MAIFGQDDGLLRIRAAGVRAPARYRVIADAHLGLEDDREAPFRPYSARMAAFSVHDADALRDALRDARGDGVDAVLLLGDILSYPSEAGVEGLRAALDEAALPWRYVAGNHDWHYEGLPGTDADQRAQWSARRLAPLYQGLDPLASAWTRDGVKFLFVDNSTCEILPGQLAFLRRELADGLPAVLCVHVPLYVPGRGIFFSCGHPGWGAAADPYWEIERRERWRADGPAPETLAFRDEVFAAPNVLAVLAGHTHRFSADYLHQKVQWVAPGFASGGAYLDLVLEPGE